MKKFRLKTIYPGSQKLRTIVTFQPPIYIDTDSGTIYNPNLIENEPHFWEELPNDYLFTSENGRDIFEGDTWFYVKEGSTEITSTTTLHYGGKNKKSVKRFSSKNAAYDYIKNTIPLLSIHDIYQEFKRTDFISTEEHNMTTDLIDSLKKLVKNRLKIK